MPGSSVPERGGGSGKIPNIWYTFQTTVLNKTICYTKIAKLFPVDHFFCWINLIYIYIYISNVGAENSPLRGFFIHDQTFMFILKMYSFKFILNIHYLTFKMLLRMVLIIHCMKLVNIPCIHYQCLSAPPDEECPKHRRGTARGTLRRLNSTL